MKKQHICYPTDESNNMLQIKTTFKKINKVIDLGKYPFLL